MEFASGCGAAVSAIEAGSRWYCEHSRGYISLGIAWRTACSAAEMTHRPRTEANIFATRTAISFLLVLALGATDAFSLPIALRLTDGLTEVTITDGGAGDMNGAPDVITFLGAVGAWNINISGGFGSDTIGPGKLDLFSASAATGGTSSTLTVLFTQSDNMAEVPAYSLELGGTFSNVASIAYQAYVDDANNPFGLSQLIGTVGPFTTDPFAGTSPGAIAVSGPYSLTQVLTITGGGEGEPSFYSADAELSPVPEPASLILIGSGMAGAAAWKRRRRAQPRA